MLFSLNRVRLYSDDCTLKGNVTRYSVSSLKKKKENLLISKKFERTDDPERI